VDKQNRQKSGRGAKREYNEEGKSAEGK